MIEYLDMNTIKRVPHIGVLALLCCINTILSALCSVLETFIFAKEYKMIHPVTFYIHTIFSPFHSIRIPFNVF